MVTINIKKGKAVSSDSKKEKETKYIKGGPLGMVYNTSTGKYEQPTAAQTPESFIQKNIDPNYSGKNLFNQNNNLGMSIDSLEGGYKAPPSMNPKKNIITGKKYIGNKAVSDEEYENYLINARNEAFLGRDLLTPEEKYNQEAELKQLLGSVGNVGDLSPERINQLLSGISGSSQFEQGLLGALREGAVTAGTRAISYGAAGAAGGAFAGGIGAIPGAAIGAIAGVVSGFWSALAKAKPTEAKEDVRNAMAEFTQLKRGMSNVAMMTTSGQMNSQEGVELFNAQYLRMLELQSQLKYLADNDLKDYLSGGGTDLVTINTYLAQIVPAYQARMRTAVLNPSSSTIPYSDDILSQIGEDFL